MPWNCSIGWEAGFGVYASARRVEKEEVRSGNVEKNFEGWIDELFTGFRGVRFKRSMPLGPLPSVMGLNLVASSVFQLFSCSKGEKARSKGSSRFESFVSAGFVGMDGNYGGQGRRLSRSAAALKVIVRANQCAGQIFSSMIIVHCHPKFTSFRFQVL